MKVKTFIETSDDDINFWLEETEETIKVVDIKYNGSNVLIMYKVEEDPTVTFYADEEEQILVGKEHYQRLKADSEQLQRIKEEQQAIKDQIALPDEEICKCCGNCRYGTTINKQATGCQLFDSIYYLERRTPDMNCCTRWEAK